MSYGMDSAGRGRGERDGGHQPRFRGGRGRGGRGERYGGRYRQHR